MHKLFTLFAISGLLLTNNANACSFGGVDLFKPSLERWEQHAGPKQKDRNAEGDYWEKVPAPLVQVLKVTRGTTSPGSSCNDAGTVELEISLPEGSTYDISEFGFYFRVTKGKLPDEIFPDIPLTGEIKNGKVILFLAWLDGHPKYQFPLDLNVDVFMITNGLNIGESTTFKIKSGVGNK